MTNESNARNQAQAQINSIVVMVAALNCDYDRLEELKAEKEELQCNLYEATTKSKYSDYIASAKKELAEWEAEFSGELEELEEQADHRESRDDAEQTIHEDALSVECRSSWAGVGEELEPTEYRILLCTGGPHVELVGELGLYSVPVNARILYQDWFTGKEEYTPTSGETEALLEYAQCFYFGE